MARTVISVDAEAYDRFRRAVMRSTDGRFGTLGREASKALEAHAAALDASEERKGKTEHGDSR